MAGTAPKTDATTLNRPVKKTSPPSGTTLNRPVKKTSPPSGTRGTPEVKNREVTWCVLACLLAFLIAFITTTSAVLFFSKSYERVPAQECLVVSTSSGKVQGALVEFTVAEKSHSTVAFYGIPFASPPVEKRRFAPPTCPTPWKDAFNATYKRPPCAEHNTVLTKNHVIDAPNTTEDCLHVNVWVPGSCVDRKPSHRRAIVFWLHGGSFVFGGNSYDFYDGRFMAALGDVVVVVPNYRVWSFGFLNSETADVAGNMALHDVLLALNWVQRNAERFGGDPDRILGAGQSAGAIIVSLLMASPLTSARASFRRAYLLSGSMHTPLPGNTGDFAKENFDKLATIAGCVQPDLPGKLHCMRGLNASALIRANRAIPMSIMPSFEAPLFPGRPDRFLRSRGVDTIMGTTLNEGMAMFQQLWPNVVENHVKVTIGAIKPSFGYFFAGVSDRELASAFQLLGAFYNIDDPDNKGWIDLFGDVLFHCPQIALGKQLSAIGKKVFFRKYVPKPSFSKFAGDGATHGEDATMLFGVPFLYPTISTDEEKTMSLRMISTIANFAKDGSVPSLRNGKEWPSYSDVNHYPVVQLTHAGYALWEEKGDRPPSCAIYDFIKERLPSLTSAGGPGTGKISSMLAHITRALQESMRDAPPEQRAKLEAYLNSSQQVS